MTPFFYHPRMLEYNFGASHPLKPERLRRTIELVKLHTNLDIIDPGSCPESVLEITHEKAYVEFIKARSEQKNQIKDDESWKYGFGYGDCPYFIGAHEASQAYCGGSLAAAQAVNDGAQTAISISGGLHHAKKAKASGFCIYNDLSIAIIELKKRFSRIAYVDIDVHHGDGVEELFWDDPNVLTCSIHQDGRTLYPGTGFVDRTPEHKTAVNVTLLPDSTAEVWKLGFDEGIMSEIQAFRPDALVVQSGTDAHLWDPLAKQRLRTQDYLEAVKNLHGLNLPTVVVGGGGYHLECVPRMWLGAICIWSGQEAPSHLGKMSADQWNMPLIKDIFEPDPWIHGKEHVQEQISYMKQQIVPVLATK